MKGKNAQKSSLKSKIFQIPIEDYKIYIDKEPSKEKKKEIFDLFTTYNKLLSEEDFNEIQNDLHYACREGDLELIQVLLSETIKIDSNSPTFKIDEKNKTATLIKVNKNIEELIIPRIVEHESTEYLITSIYRTGQNVKIIKFSEDSSVKKIFGCAFYDSKIEEIYFPDTLKELKEGWCCGTNNLRKIIISPSNGQFKFKDNKYLVGKSDSNNDEYDNLLFVRRDIKEFSIPSNIKIISSDAFSYSKIEAIFIPPKVSKICVNAFYNCQNLIKVEIPTNSNLQIIEKHAFSKSNIESIFIPSKVSQILENAFYNCQNLTKIEIPKESNLQTIEKYAFSYLNIESFFIPSKVTKIYDYAFSDCINLKKIEIPTNSNLQTVESNIFYDSKIEEIYFPASLKELKEGWCNEANNLKRIIISPLNGQFKFEDGKYLISKSESNSTEFDTLLFVRRDIEEFLIPSNIKIISSDTFHNCRNLKKIEIPTNSNLLEIDKNTFSYLNIESIFIPSKVIKICESAFYCCHHLTKIVIPTNSNLQIIDKYAFHESKIEEIYFPYTLKELKEGWCCGTNNLRKIIISPSNGQFKFKDNKYLVGKSDSNNDEYDNLLFVRRDIKEFSIPSNIKIISSYVFHNCRNLAKIEIPTNSNLQTIGKYAFSGSIIESIFIPSEVSKICEYAFYCCYYLTKVEIPTNSNLKAIELIAFSYSNIESISIPSKVSKICEYAFSDCENLQIFEISEESEIKSLPFSVFEESQQLIIMIPSSLRKLIK